MSLSAQVADLFMQQTIRLIIAWKAHVRLMMLMMAVFHLGKKKKNLPETLSLFRLTGRIWYYRKNEFSYQTYSPIHNKSHLITLCKFSRSIAYSLIDSFTYGYIQFMAADGRTPCQKHA